MTFKATFMWMDGFPSDVCWEFSADLGRFNWDGGVPVPPQWFRRMNLPKLTVTTKMASHFSVDRGSPS